MPEEMPKSSYISHKRNEFFIYIYFPLFFASLAACSAVFQCWLCHTELSWGLPWDMRVAADYAAHGNNFSMFSYLNFQPIYLIIDCDQSHAETQSPLHWYFDIFKLINKFHRQSFTRTDIGAGIMLHNLKFSTSLNIKF